MPLTATWWVAFPVAARLNTTNAVKGMASRKAPFSGWQSASLRKHAGVSASRMAPSPGVRDGQKWCRTSPIAMSAGIA